MPASPRPFRTLPVVTLVVLLDGSSPGVVQRVQQGGRDALDA